MGRPSLADVRTEQLLGAVEQSILESGLDGATVARVSEIADMRPSHVRHYLGDRDSMIDTAVRRAVSRVEMMMDEAVAGLDSEQRLDALLDAMFDARLAAPNVNQLIDELIAASYRNAEIQQLVQAMYKRFGKIIDATLAGAFPGATKSERKPVAHALLALAHASATFEWLKLDRNHYEHARIAANTILARLRHKVNP
jgi:AcrR family transcriptional regulator